MDETGCQNLVEGIVKQAVKDWKNATKKLKSKSKDNLHKRTIYVHRRTKYECERFFESDYFFSITGLDGNSIFQRLKDESK